MVAGCVTTTARISRSVGGASVKNGVVTSVGEVTHRHC